jgi:hypothetical protein
MSGCRTPNYRTVTPSMLLPMQHNNVRFWG